MILTQIRVSLRRYRRFLVAVAALLVILTVVSIGVKSRDGRHVRKSASSATGLPSHEINAQNCPKMNPSFVKPSKPVWVAGYPGSGFDLMAPLAAAITGLTSMDVYTHHSCVNDDIIDPSIPPIAACISHWPMVPKDSPATLAVNGEVYYARSIFMIRNPAEAIPSYHTRWWNAQKRNDLSNKQQAPEEDWKSWRDDRFSNHLELWKRSLIEWQRGVPAAGVKGIALYLEYNDLIDREKGPQLSEELAKVFQSAGIPVSDNAFCLWHRIYDNAKLPKQYYPSFTNAQKKELLDTLEDVITHYQFTEPQLVEILSRYKGQIESDVRTDEEEDGE
jgi:hypothetical protein